jgi:universal stress protein A
MVIGALREAAGNSRQPAGREGSAVHPEALRFGRVLVPTDFSDASRKALRYAARFAEQFGTRVSLIHVIEPVMSPDFTHFPLALDQEKVTEAARQRLASLGRNFLSPACLGDLIVRNGSPFHEIAETARELKTDLIIISTHGYTGLKRALLGSTAERVVRHASCAVMTVR